MKAYSALALIGVLTAASVTQGQGPLRLSLTPGKTYRFASSTTVTGGPTGNMTQSMDYLVKILKKVGDVYHVETKIANSKMTGQMASGPQAEAIKKATEAGRIVATYNGRGTQLSMKMAGANDPQVQQVGAAMGMMNFGFLGLEFPSGPARVGTTWTKKHDLKKLMASSLGPMASQLKISSSPLTIKYTVKQISGNAVTIGSTFDGTMTMSMSQQGKKLNFKIKMGGTGTSIVDKTTGLQKSTTMNMTNTISGPMQMTQKMTTTMKLK
jgi:hypothetical protein